MASAKDSRGPGFPLAPFFTTLLPLGVRVTLDDYRRIGAALAAGGPWSLERLRYVLAALIVRDPTIEPAFHRRFDEFFATRSLDETGGIEIDVERVLDELRSLAAERKPTEPPIEPPDVPRGPHKADLEWKRRLLAIGTAVIGWADWLLVAALFLAIASSTIRVAVQDSPGPVPEPPGRTGAVLITDTPQRRYRNVPFIERIEELETPGAASWKIPALLGGLGLLASLGYALWLRRARRPPRDPALFFDPELDQHFDAGTVGGAPEPWLDRQTLDHLADSVTFFQGEAAGRRLDARTTIARTANAGGCPRLVFERRRRVRRVIVLEDGFAEAGAWNPLAGELARGLERRGIPVLHGRFWGSPERFVSDERSEVLLDDLTDERGACLLFIFSDGKSLRGPQARHVLEQLASWPRVAWMDLREPRSWDESAALPASVGLPVWPASRAGLVEAMARFTDERGGAKERPDWRDWGGVPPRPGDVPVAVHIEHGLGDTLLWAQACAMVPPPLTPALADRIRRACYPDLPPERIERLYRLPGTVVTRQGLCFSQAVRAALRSGFVVRHEDSEQERVLVLIHEALRASEPKETNGLAHLAWEWRCERVHLELDPDTALERLSALAASPLGTAIRQDLGTTAVPGRERAGASEALVIPLRRKPATRRGMQRLLGLAPSCGIGRGEAYPVGRSHRLILAGSVVLSGLLLGWSAWVYFRPPDALDVIVEGANFSNVRLVSDPGHGSVDRGGASRFSGPLPPLPGLSSQITFVDTGAGASRFSGIPANSRQELWFLEGDHVSKQQVEIGRSSRRVFVGQRELVIPCSESWRDKGLTVFRCPAGTEGIVDLPTWRETLGASAPDGRFLSVALDIRMDGKQRPRLDELVDTLLRSRSVDRAYRIDLAGAAMAQDAKSSAAKVNDALGLVQEQLGPWIAGSQVLAWAVGPEPESALIDLPEPFLVGRIVGLARVHDDWVSALIELLRQGRSPVVEEEDLFRMLPDAEVTGEGPPVRLAALPAERSDVLKAEGTVFSSGTIFRDRLADGSDGPEMVVVPAGRFLMGSADSDKAAYANERPQHEVTIPKPFAMGKYEVSFEEYDRFAKAAGRRLPGRGRQPAINVSFDDAQAYAEWLSKETGQMYRLPSEAEWEHAARAGKETAYWWGPDVGKDQAHCAGCGSRWDAKQTAPVGSFAPNPYGLYDTAGNVREWVEDCYHSTYASAPADGRAWVDDETCGSRVLRGGSWNGDPGWLRSANRDGFGPGGRNDRVGFRLARTL